MPEIPEKDNISIIRKRQIFRSWHRGTREIDLLLGKFADAHVPDFNAAQVEEYERFLKNSDPDIYNWLTRVEPVPPAEDSGVVQMLLAFYPR